MNRGDVYWVNFDPAVGSEIRKTRPAVIVSNEGANDAASRIQVVPLSSNIARIRSWEALVHVADRPAKAMADQIKTTPKERVGRFMGQLSTAEMFAVEHALRRQLGLP